MSTTVPRTISSSSSFLCSRSALYRCDGARNVEVPRPRRCPLNASSHSQNTPIREATSCASSSSERRTIAFFTLHRYLRVGVLNRDLEALFDLVPNLGLGRVRVDDELELVLEVHVVHRLLRDQRVFDGRAHRSATSSSALSVQTVSRPGCAPGARSSALTSAAVVTSAPARFRAARDGPVSLDVTKRIDVGVLYLRPRAFP